MGPADSAAYGKDFRAIQPDLDRRAARLLRRRRPCGARRTARHPDRNRRDVDKRPGALGLYSPEWCGFPDAGRAARRRHFAVFESGDTGRVRGPANRAAFFNGTTHPSRRRDATRAMGGAFRMAGAIVQ